MSASKERDDVGDEQLCGELRAGNLDALGHLYERHGRHLLRVAARITGSWSDAEEIVQDVFVGLPTSVRRYPEIVNLRAWLSQVTARLSVDRVRREKRRRHLPIEDVDVAVATTDDCDALSIRMAVTRALARLSEDMRVVLVLRLVEGYSHSEIAQLLGIRRGTSEVRFFRALRAMRQLLERSAGE